jgi:hypothetical protein
MKQEEQLTNAVDIIIGGSEKGNRLLILENDLSDKSFFEGILYNSLKVLNHLQLKIPNDYPSIWNRFCNELFIIVTTTEYRFILPFRADDIEGFIGFISTRKKQYSQELNSEEDYKNMLATLVNNIYENPVNTDLIKSNNLELIMELSMKMEYIHDFQNECASVIIKNCEYE